MSIEAPSPTYTWSDDDPMYPSCDGKPMAESTRQYDCLTFIKGNSALMFRHNPEVFVAGDLLWYPVKGRPDLCAAPDVFIVLGRPSGARSSYRQWLEEGIAPQVVFEVLSPGNRLGEMIAKLLFYQNYGVEEYYVYDPESGELTGCQRSGDKLVPIPDMQGWVSPLLGVRFEVVDKDLKMWRSDGQPFLTLEELEDRAILAELRVERAQGEAMRAQEEAERIRVRAARLEARLRELGIDPDAADG